MSRIGRMPIKIPAGVAVTINKDNTVTVKGATSTLSLKVNPSIKVTVDNDVISLTRANDENKTRALHGLSRTLISNMIEGVVKGYSKELEINGVGFRAKQGSSLF